MQEEVNGIGIVEYKRHARAKHIKIRLRPGQPVQVTLPKYAAVKDARKFVVSKRDWILEKQRELQEHVPSQKQFEVGSTYTFKDITLHVKRDTKTNAHHNYEDNQLIISIADDTSIATTDLQDWIQRQLEDFLRVIAAYTLPQRVRQLAQQHQIPIRKVTVRRAKTRWGSCSGTNNINLSCYVYLLPDHLIDYVIYHELAHVKEKNHSAQYWAHLASLLPDALERHQEMKGYRLGFS
jgi:predicted metal-dependent hydrolase